MSSWRKKMRVKWNRNLDGGPSPSNAVGGDDSPQLGLFERQGSLRKPSSSDKEEPFKRSWSFRIGGSGSKTKDASPGGNDKNAFLRMFRFGKDKKKGGHQEPGRRRMSDAAVTETAARKEELSQWSSVPLDVSESPEAKRRQEAALVMRAHTLPRSLEAAPGGSERPDDAGGDANAIWGRIYCDPRAEVNGDHIRPPRAKSPRNRESRSGKIFSEAVLPHFLSPGLDLSGGDAEQDEKRALKKLLLNGTCPAVEGLSENADVVHSVANGTVVSAESEAVSADCGPPSADSVQADSGVASGADSCSEGKFLLIHSDTERDEVPSAASEHEISLLEQDSEPASNVTFVVEVNECYQDDCDQTQQAPCIENNREDTQLLADTEDRSHVYAANHDGTSEIYSLESNADAHDQVANEDAEATNFERSCRRQRHDSASTGSNCEECPAQDEFEFVAAEHESEQQRRMSRETVSPISDVSDDFPADEKASFIFLKPDRAGESFLSPLSTPDHELDGGPFGHQALIAGDDCGTPGERYENGACSESDLESEDLNVPEEREVIIVDHLPAQESQDAVDVCVIGSDMIQSVNYGTFVLENEVTLGTSGASSAQEVARSGGTRATTAQADSPPPADVDGSASRDAVEEEVPGANKLEASEGSFQDKLQYFNAISTSQPKAVSENKRPRTSRIPTASRLPRPSTAARPAKKESGIPVLTAAPVPAKRSRFGAKVGHIPQPSRNNAPQQKQQATPSLTRVTAAVAPNRDCSVTPRVPLLSGISKNAKHARHAAAESNIAATEEASKAQEAPGQLKRSGTFVLEESEQQPTIAVRSASLPRTAVEKDVVVRDASPASPRP
ncbi:hypothetical protein HPB51_017077 [Rhipicephalus microplus]|uniref:Uncharacterized protein n=1 Tax=Rhipicephalus microplus TaxID=6941 RepID=A0A9J6F7M9_RHIMP|nr:hypothetical protein HPB51_017077 [Rhipicephalus microplus]